MIAREKVGVVDKLFASYLKGEDSSKILPEEWNLVVGNPALYVSLLNAVNWNAYLETGGWFSDEIQD